MAVTQVQPTQGNVPYRILTPEQIDLGPAARFLNFWNDCRGDRLAPRWGADFRLVDLPVDVLPNVSVVDVIDGGRRYFYRFWGSNNVVIKGFEMSQKYLEDSPASCIRANGVHQFGEVLRQRRPLVFLYESAYQHGLNVGCFTLRAPLSSDGEVVDKIASFQDLALRHDDWEELFGTLRSIGDPPDERGVA